jgi:hypothetical protein
MSIANLLNPNNLDIQCNNLTCNTMDCGSVVVSGVDTPGELTLTGGLGVDITATTGTVNINGNTEMSGGLTISTNEFFGLLVNSTTSDASNELLVQKSNVSVSGFGHNDFTNETYVWSFQATDPIKFGPGNTERLRLAATGISNDNTANQVLAINGTAGATTVAYKNNLTDTSTAQTLTNKTIDSSNNTLTITNSPLIASNINTIINQNVQTTASPSFSSLTLTNGISQFNSSIVDYNGVANVASGAGNITYYTLSTSTNHSYWAEFTTIAQVVTSTGSDLGKAFFQKGTYGVTNNAGTVTTNTIANQAATNGITAGQNIAISSANVNFQFGGNSTDTMRLYWYLKIWYN